MPSGGGTGTPSRNHWYAIIPGDGQSESVEPVASRSMVSPTHAVAGAVAMAAVAAHGGQSTTSSVTASDAAHVASVEDRLAERLGIDRQLRGRRPPARKQLCTQQGSGVEPHEREAR